MQRVREWEREIMAQNGIAKWEKSQKPASRFFRRCTCSNVENNNFTFATDRTTVQINNCNIYRETIVCCLLFFFISSSSFFSLVHFSINFPRLARARFCKHAIWIHNVFGKIEHIEKKKKIITGERALASVVQSCIYRFNYMNSCDSKTSTFFNIYFYF